MRNLKHTIMAIVSVAMVGTLSFFQVSNLSVQGLEKHSKLSTASNQINITIDEAESSDEEAQIEEEESEAEVQPTEEVITNAAGEQITEEQAIAEKSALTAGYAKVTGTADLKAAPGDEAEVIGTMSGAENLEILESTEDWYKVCVNGVSGYVKKELVTLSKFEADVAVKQQDNYKKAVVSSDSGLRVRASGSENSASLAIIEKGTQVIIVDQQDDYIKVLCGNDYMEGYVINSGLEWSGEWVTKNEVHAEVKRIAAEKEAARKEAERKAAEEARRAAANRESARLAAMGYSKDQVKSSSSSNAVSTPSSSATGQAIVNTAMKYLGVPYVWGGTSPKGFDCSGLVQYVCRKNGISLPRVAASQAGVGKSVSRANLQPGDLLFFSSGGGISHVGIYVGNGNMIHAPQTGDVVKISSINSSYRVRTYVCARRVW